MAGSETETILLVCDCDDRSADILGRLQAAGYAVIGPVQNAGTAMAVAAHTPPTLALIARPPNGRRNATEFAQDLMQTWGVRSWILDHEADAASDWAAEDGRVAHIRDIIRTPIGSTDAHPTGSLAGDPVVAA